MVDLGAYIFKDLNIRGIKLEESFTDAYVKELYESEHALTDTKLLHIILDAKYKKSDLHKVMETQCQILTMTQRNDLLKLLHKCEDFLWNTWNLENISSKLLVKRGCESSMLATIPSNKTT